MKVFDYQEIKAEEATMHGAKGVKVRWLIAEKDGAPNFAMRLFEVEPDGCSPLHTHDWEHEVFIVEGEGLANDGENQTKIKRGSVIYVAPNEKHQFKNTGAQPLKFICIIPIKK
jgi:quercetin dioxygenase-like cupin family protein